MPAVGVHHTATATGSWDAAANVKRIANDAPVSTLKAEFAYVEGDSKSSCKFPHHFVSGDGKPGAASTVACSAGIAALNGGRGGANVGSAREGIYRHLAAHLRDAKMTPPELKSLDGFDIERRITPGIVQVRAGGLFSTEEEPGEVGDIPEELNPEPQIGGYAAVFNKLSQNLGGFVENVNRSFFNKAEADGFKGVVARFNHDDNLLLGTTSSGTLRLSIDDTGLDYTVAPPSSRSDVIELVQRGDITKSSFAFRAIEDDWDMTEQGFPMRNLISGQLIDVAPVVSPAYMDTTSGLRSLARKFDAEYEEVLILAEANELRRFFVRTDRPSVPEKSSTMWGYEAAAHIRSIPRDPWQDRIKEL